MVNLKNYFSSNVQSVLLTSKDGFLQEFHANLMHKRVFGQTNLVPDPCLEYKGQLYTYDGQYIPDHQKKQPHNSMTKMSCKIIILCLKYD